MLYLGAEPSPCQTCGDGDALLRCLDCFSSGPFCQSCIVLQHAHSVLHRIQVTPLPHLFSLRLTSHFLRNGTGRSSWTHPSSNSAHRTNSVTTSTIPAIFHLNPPRLLCSTSLAFIQYASCTAYVARVGSHPPPTVPNCSVPAGSPQRVLAPALRSRFVSSTSSTSFKPKAR